MFLLSCIIATTFYALVTSSSIDERKLDFGQLDASNSCYGMTFDSLKNGSIEQAKKKMYSSSTQGELTIIIITDCNSHQSWMKSQWIDIW